MTTPPWQTFPPYDIFDRLPGWPADVVFDRIAILDYWTRIALKAYWEELVKETQEASFTGATPPQDLSTGPT